MSKNKNSKIVQITGVGNGTLVALNAEGKMFFTHVHGSSGQVGKWEPMPELPAEEAEKKDKV